LISVCSRLFLKTLSSGARASGFSPDKDGEAGDMAFIVDGAPDVHRDSQVDNSGCFYPTVAVLAA